MRKSAGGIVQRGKYSAFNIFRAGVAVFQQVNIRVAQGPPLPIPGKEWAIVLSGRRFPALTVKLENFCRSPWSGVYIPLRRNPWRFAHSLSAEFLSDDSGEWHQRTSRIVENTVHWHGSRLVSVNSNR